LAKSPDLNPIENVWPIMKFLGFRFWRVQDQRGHLGGCGRIGGRDPEAWNEISQDEINQLVITFPHRLHDRARKRKLPNQTLLCVKDFSKIAFFASP
jgi:hypothetical protein